MKPKIPAGVPVPASGLSWLIAVSAGILVLSLLPAKYRWLMVLWLALSGLAWFSTNKRRGPLESFADVDKMRF